MSAYDDRPWLALYGDQPADYDARVRQRPGHVPGRGGEGPVRGRAAVLRRQHHPAASSTSSATRWPAGLLAYGFSAGDRLAVYLQNVPQFVIAMVAAWKAGGVMVSINPMSRTRELSYLLKDSGATVLVALEALYDEVAREVVPGHRRPAGAHHQRAGVPDPRRRAAVRRASSRQRHEGTTDFARVHRRAPRRGAAAGRARAGRRRVPDLHVGDDGRAQGCDEHPPERRLHRAGLPGLGARRAGTARIFGIAPLFHITGLIGHIAVSMLAPAPLVLAYRFEPQVVLDAFLEHRPTFTIGAITAFNALLNAPGFTKDHFASFTSVYSGGAAISPTAEKAFLEATGHPGAQRLRPDRDDVADDRDAVRVAVAGRPDVGCAVGRGPGAEHDRPHPGRRRAGPAPRRDRRDRRRRPAGRRRLLGQARGDGGEPARRCAQERRRRLHEPRGLGVHRRPQEGHDQRVGLQGLAARGRGRAGRAPRRPGVRGGRRARTRSAARRSRRSSASSRGRR